MDSILTSIKKLLGIAEEYTHFDGDLIIHINTALAILNQLGVGPTEGFYITDDKDLWSDFIDEEPKLQPVKSYVYLKTRLIFDPPAQSSVATAMTNVITELESRLMITADPELIIVE